MAASEIKPAEIYSKISKGELLHIYDVRESEEYKSLRIADSTSLPLSVLTQYHRFVVPNKEIYLLCRSGQRAHFAAQKLVDLGVKNPIVIEGGLNAWQKSGLPVTSSPPRTWSMDRQVRFTAGILLLIGMALSVLNSNWLFLSAFVSLGMIISAVSDTCAMATFLQMMPWNKPHAIQ